MASTTVTGFKLGLTNTGRFHYALAQLACGHLGDVQLVPQILTCMGCGTTFARPHGDYSRHACTGCGCEAYRCGPMPDPHAEADRLTTIGDEVDCTDCDRDAEQTTWLRVPANLAAIHHTRFRNGIIYLYRLDHTSPSQFMLVRGVSATPEHEALLTGSLAPLSPTERA